MIKIKNFDDFNEFYIICPYADDYVCQFTRKNERDKDIIFCESFEIFCICKEGKELNFAGI